MGYALYASVNSCIHRMPHINLLTLYAIIIKSKLLMMTLNYTVLETHLGFILFANAPISLTECMHVKHLFSETFSKFIETE